MDYITNVIASMCKSSKECKHEVIINISASFNGDYVPLLDKYGQLPCKVNYENNEFNISVGQDHNNRLCKISKQSSNFMYEMCDLTDLLATKIFVEVSNKISLSKIYDENEQ